jgi:hypothetical protein
LFIITAAALGRARLDHRTPPAPAPTATSSRPSDSAMPPSPLTVYRDGPGVPSLRTWLARQVTDRREQVTIVTQYAPGSEAAVPARVAVLLTAALAAGVHARIEIEPGSGSTSAGIGFDPPRQNSPESSNGSLARPLRKEFPDQQDRDLPG